MTEAADALSDLQARADNAQQLANMGDYDWHIPTDTNIWSDHLYRMFGYEPQSQNVDYTTYMDHCHPEDREYVATVHQQTFATGEPYTFTHRIVRTDGEVRHLLCNGEMISDESGTPIRLRGTSVDITDRVLAERAREEEEARLYDERMRRQAALEINDNVLQGLTSALYALEVDDEHQAVEHLRRTLDSAQRVITDLGGAFEGGEIAPGDLVRSRASSLPGV